MQPLAEMPSIQGHRRIRLGERTGWWIKLTDLRVNARLIADGDGARSLELIEKEDYLEEGLWVEWADAAFGKKVLELFLWRPIDETYFCIEPGEESP